jgi:hypothetical protein
MRQAGNDNTLVPNDSSARRAAPRRAANQAWADSSRWLADAAYPDL